jgi:hypothetical protein
MMFSTFAEQRHFVYPRKDTYHGIILNANMAAHAPDGIARFILTRTYQQRYIIDPMTHAFQHDPRHITDSEGKVKRSVMKMAEQYGELIADNVGKRPLLPSMLQDKDQRKDFVKSCLNFQESHISQRIETSDDAKYINFDEQPGTAPKPFALLAPYFYMKEATAHLWLDINVKLAELAVEQKEDIPIFGMLVLSQGILLNDTLVNEIVEKFKSISLNGFLIWIDDLNEGVAEESHLKGLISLGRKLRAISGPGEVINLHGGYFSILATSEKLGSPALSGVCHGPEFGEYRPVIPVGGGIPIARYYIPLLHERIRYREALAVLKEMGFLRDAASFHAKVCCCTECKNTIGNNPENFTLFGESNVKLVKRGSGLARMEYPTPRTKLRCLQHYLERKQIEYQFASTASKQQLMEDLNSGHDRFKEIIGLDQVSHLKTWKECFEGE